MSPAEWVSVSLSTLSIIVAVISLIKSWTAQNVQDRLNDLELKIKQNEIEKIEKQKQEDEKSMVSCNILHVSKGKYKIKLCNISKQTVYNVSCSIDEQYNILVFNQGVMPFEELTSMDSFELPLIIHTLSARKFEVTITWLDKDNKEYSYKKLTSLD